RFEIENLSKQVPSYYRIHSLAVRNDPLPRTVTRKLKRFEIQREENQRIKKPEKEGAPVSPDSEDDSRFREGAGAVLAKLVRQAKSDAGPLRPSLNIELDLGFDSLGRVELLGLAEAQLGVHIDEHAAAGIYTLGELIDAFEEAGHFKGPD